MKEKVRKFELGNADPLLRWNNGTKLFCHQ
jgi:hypothetical protein